MPSTPRYQYDAFISYAHLDNEPASSEEVDGWITAFQAQLELFTSMRLGRRARVWRDTLLTAEDLATEDQLARAIEQALARCAVLVIVMSPRFATRKWLAKELDSFTETAGGAEGLTLAKHKSRVFVVYIDKTDRAALPEYLQRFTGWEFFSKSGNALSRGDQQYKDRLNHLTHAVGKALSEIEASDT